MRRFRFSVGSLMLTIVLTAAGFAALRSPTPFWANIWFSLVLTALTLAIPAAVYRRDEQRAFWAGFAACGWTYFVLTMAPWFEREIGFQLFTTTLLDLMAPHVVQKELLVRRYVASFKPPSDPTPPSPWQ